jgi:hypothetical protein
LAADILIVPARAAHIRTIARRMRAADREEIAAMSGRSPAGALVYSLRRSSCAWTVMVDGRPEIMFGVGDINILTRAGSPWLLGTDAVERHYVAFLRGSVGCRDQLFTRYASLVNFVDVRNAASVRWLRWLGFSLSGPILIRGHEFYLFERSADV